MFILLFGLKTLFCTIIFESWTMRRFLWTRKLYLSLGDFDCDEIVHIVEIGVPAELNLGAN